MHAGAAGADHGRHHVDVAAAALHALLVLYPAQQGNLVTQLSSALEVQFGGGLFHRCTQLVGQQVAAPLEEHHRVAHVLGILLGTYQPDAGSLAALDLVLQAGPGAILEVAVLALAHLEGLLQQAEALANRQAAGIGAEIAALGLLRPAMNPQARIFVLAAEQHVGVGFIVAQQDVVGRPPFLDQRLLK
ncbi:hypothetical protein D3C80_1393140 [compost metagenome]